MQGLNSLKYFSTIVALVMRTLYSQNGGTFWRVMAASTSGVTTVANTYWDLVIDWGLFQRNSKNPWLRDKLLVPHKIVYFVAIVLDIILRLVWMQLVLDFKKLPFLHEKAFAAIVACLEILRRGLWNFFRLENEHLNNGWEISCLEVCTPAFQLRRRQKYVKGKSKESRVLEIQK